MKKIFEKIIAFMLHFGIVLIFSTWVFHKLVGYDSPEYIAFMFSLWIFFTGMKMFKVNVSHMTAAEMKRELEDLQIVRKQMKDLDEDLDKETVEK